MDSVHLMFAVEYMLVLSAECTLEGTECQICRGLDESVQSSYNSALVGREEQTRVWCTNIHITTII